MCVLIYKPKGVFLPLLDTLKQCRNANPDGFGFATLNGAFFKSLDFKAFVSELYRRVTPDDDAMLHFRWATSGSVKRSNCHPFRINDFVLAHNGIVPVPTNGDKTDTETFFRMAYPYLKEKGLNSKVSNQIFGDFAATSKFVIFDTAKKKVQLNGDFTRHIDECLYSNMRWVLRPALSSCNY